MAQIRSHQEVHLREDLEYIREKEEDILRIIEDIFKNFHNDGVIHGLIMDLNEINLRLGNLYYNFFQSCIDVYWQPDPSVKVKSGKNDGHNRGSGFEKDYDDEF